MTVLEGELHAVLETTEVVLKAGNTFVQTGGGHAWSNRTDRPVKAVLTMIDASQ